MQTANGLANGESSTNRGVNVAVESQSEWKIDYIQYDGTEVFLPPPDFAEIVSKNVAKIQWRDVLEGSSSADVDDEEADEAEKAEKDLTSFDSVREAARDRILPAAGPWAGVAKCLHESLQEVDVLLDLLRISRTEYLSTPKVVPQAEDNRSVDLLNKSRSFLWVSRRKAFSDAINILDIASRVRHHGNFDEKAAYFSELKAMRENWRIRKINEFVFGDLGYRIYGPKFAQGELFDIFWNPQRKTSESNRAAASPRCIQVQVPKNLMRRTKLFVSLVKDSPENQDKIFSDTSAQSQAIYEQTDNSRNLPWETTLKWAQESLVNRDIFTRLMKESVNENHICIVTENTIIVCLSNGMLLKIERRHFPMMEMDIPELGDPYLSGMLHNFFIRDVVRTPHRPQLFVGFPVTALPETLDLRGSQAVPADEIASRIDKVTPLLTRMIQVSDHYVLVDQVVDVLGQQMLCKDDPQFTWRWIRATSTFSMISATFVNQAYETLGKVAFTIKINTKEVNVVTKDNLTINCHRQMKLLQETLSLMSANCQLLAASLLGKTYCWQVLHANMNAFCKEGTSAPTFYACNQTASKKIFIQFFIDGRPYQIYVKRRPIPTQNGPAKEERGPFQNNLADNATKLNDDPDDISTFVPVNSSRVAGKSFLRKLDYLYTMLRS